ncbi:FKBP-type peptidyl-prolyl cis-trans isomerase [Sunxiuqinia sp. A32]|uniref:FKBP-type peptidyl-prolyl cis-trans isomerase n=1 Tax=Sunxiuqinia sp. A32 TaxID=3461496 RepID=UPI0040467DAB
MKRYLVFLLAIAGIIAAISSCKEDNNLDELRAEEVRLLEEYIAENYADVEPTSSGLYYIETEEGYGDSLIKAGDEVQIWYTGTLLSSGEVFDSTSDTLGHQFEPLKFVVGTDEVITGMSEGVTHMRLGGKARFIIPSNLGYGASSSSTTGLPRFSTLIFDVEIYKHKRYDNQ